MTTRFLCSALLSAGAVSAAGCGSSPPPPVCTVSLSVVPTTATLDHNKVGNGQLYSVNVVVPAGCPLPPLPAPMWTVSNTTAASITETGTASCKAAAAAPITVNAGGSYGTATLICD